MSEIEKVSLRFSESLRVRRGEKYERKRERERESQNPNWVLNKKQVNY